MGQGPRPPVRGTLLPTGMARTVDAPTQKNEAARPPATTLRNQPKHGTPARGAAGGANVKPPGESGGSSPHRAGADPACESRHTGHHTESEHRSHRHAECRASRDRRAEAPAGRASGPSWTQDPPELSDRTACAWPHNRGRGLRRPPSKENVKMAKKHVRTWSVLFIVEEKQIKTRRYRFIPPLRRK